MTLIEHQPEWKLVTKGHGEFTDRLRVPGGWLYRVQTDWQYDLPHGGIETSTYGTEMSIVFVPEVMP